MDLKFCFISIILVFILKDCSGNWFGDVAAKVSGWIAPILPGDKMSHDPNHVYFRLFPNRTNTSYNETLIYGDLDSIKKSSLKSSLPVIFIVPGFLSDPDANAMEFIKNAYLKKGTEANIIQVDWSDLATAKSFIPGLYYDLASENVKIVGERLSHFINYMITNGLLKGPNDVHLVGFSLGAHVSGLAGENYLKYRGSLLGRITGLDPAYPRFQFLMPSERLDATDAEFVDITHTNQGVFGFKGDLGHVDFYANGGGSTQPNCGWFARTVGVGGCPHSDAYKYFAESITNPILACNCKDEKDKAGFSSKITAQNCVKGIVYGEDCAKSARGEYCVRIS